ncbi:hypothetical protein SAMN05428952_1002123 [Nitrosomonas sp. Nm132]|nr:hypothetical protein SAMN05428952_1002123 [Nitrosomonas sp. Nm132]
MAGGGCLLAGEGAWHASLFLVIRKLLQISDKIFLSIPACLHGSDFLGRIVETCQLCRFLVAIIVIVMKDAIRQTGTQKPAYNRLQGLFVSYSAIS